MTSHPERALPAFNVGEPDPELIALPAPPKRERTATIIFMVVTTLAALALAWSLRSEAKYATSAGEPIEVGDLTRLSPDSAVRNRYVRGSGSLGTTGAIRYGRAAEGDSFRLAPIAGNDKIWVEIRVPEGFEGPRFIPPSTFAGRIVPMSDAGLRQWMLRADVKEKTGTKMPDDAWLLIDSTSPRASRWALLMTLLLLGFAAWNAVGIVRLLMRVRDGEQNDEPSESPVPEPSLDERHRARQSPGGAGARRPHPEARERPEHARGPRGAHRGATPQERHHALGSDPAAARGKEGDARPRHGALGHAVEPRAHHRSSRPLRPQARVVSEVGAAKANERGRASRHARSTRPRNERRSRSATCCGSEIDQRGRPLTLRPPQPFAPAQSSMPGAPKPAPITAIAVRGDALEGLSSAISSSDLKRATSSAPVITQVRTPLPPSPGDASVAISAGVTLVRPASAEWQPHPLWKGTSVKLLSHDLERGEYTALVRLLPGGNLPTRRHVSVEELWMVEGTALVGTTEMKAGEYSRGDAGAVHPKIASSKGCTFLLRASENDEILSGPLEQGSP